MSPWMATESLVQRGRSAFYKDLISLYQDSQDALRDSPNAPQSQINLTLKHIDIDKRLKAVVFKHTGLTVGKVVIEESAFANMAALMYPTPSSIKKLAKSEQTRSMIFEKMKNLYDDREGYLKQTPDAETLFYCTLYQNTGLWGARNKDGSFYFTAEELAAITLHEVGHFDHFIRESYRAHYRMMDASDIIDYVAHHPDQETIQALILELKKSKYLDKHWRKILSITEAYFKSNPSTTAPEYLDALSSLGTIVTAETAAWKLWDMTGLTRERVYTRLHTNNHERSADDYSARHGAYAALVSGIKKISDTDTTNTDVVLRQFLWEAPTVLLSQLVWFATLFDVSCEDIFMGYDPYIRRAELTVETAKHAFHDDSLPEGVKADIKEQIRQAEEYLQQWRNSSHKKIRLTLKAWMDNVSKFGRVIASPIHDRLSTDYEKLQDANRSLSRHPLYYLANK